MKDFRKVVWDIHSALARSLYFPSLLNAILFFLLFYIIFMLLGFSPFWAILPSMITLFFSFWRKARINRIRLVELYYPELNEKLRTAVDHADQQGIIIDELHKEVMDEVSMVRGTSFFDTGKNTSKVFLCVFLCFAILIIASLNIPFDDYRTKLKDVVNEVTQQLTAGGASGTGNSAMGGHGSNEDIYGKASIAKLGDDEVEVEIRPSAFELSIRNVGDAEELKFDREFPTDISIQSASSYEENIPKAQQEIVKNYFKNLAGGRTS